MALTKDKASITQVTGTGTSTSVSLSGSYRHSAYVKHVNGTGSILAGATVKVQCRSASGTYCDLLTIAFGTTASATELRIVPLPDDATDVQFVYTAPTGSTGHTLDVEVGRITAY